MNSCDKNTPWYKTTLRWGQTNLTEIDPAECDLEFWKEQWKKTCVQGVIINCSGIVTYYDSNSPYLYKAQHLGDKDYFKEFVLAARESGLVVIARMDINRATEDVYKKHPEWFCMDIDGNPITSQGRYFSCVNSGYYKEFIPSVLTDIIEKYHPEGFSDNSWKGIPRDTICYCDNCKDKFNKEYSLELPTEVDWESDTYKKWIEWSYDCRKDNWILFNETTSKVGGENCLWAGMINANPIEACRAFVDVKELCSLSKIIFCDHQSRDVINGFQQNSVNGNLLRFASEEDIFVPESMANYVRGSKTFRISAVPKEESNLWTISGMAGGISPWFHHVGGNQNDSRQFESPISSFQWHQKNEKYLYNRKNMSRIGVIWSRKNTDFYGRDNPEEKVQYPYTGVCMALSEDRIPFIPICIDDLDKYSDRLDTIVLPDIAVLTKEQTQSVCRFIDKGGNILLSGNTGTLDGVGNQNPQNELLKKIGLSGNHNIIGNLNGDSKTWENYSEHNYLNLPEDRHEILNGFENTNILPFGGRVNIVEHNNILKSVASYVPAFPIYPPEFSWIRQRREDIDTILFGELSSGAKIVYLAADIDRCYGKHRLPDHRKLITNSIKYLTNNKFPLYVEGDGDLDCSIYQQGNSIIVHIVNISGCNKNPGYCDKYYPVKDIKVTIDTDVKYLKAKLLVSDNLIDCKNNYDTTTITIDKIVDHEVIVLEK